MSHSQKTSAAAKHIQYTSEGCRAHESYLYRYGRTVCRNNKGQFLHSHHLRSFFPLAVSIRCTDQKAETVVDCLKKHFTIHSVPAEDRGKNFVSQLVTDFLKMMGA